MYNTTLKDIIKLIGYENAINGFRGIEQNIMDVNLDEDVINIEYLNTKTKLEIFLIESLMKIDIYDILNIHRNVLNYYDADSDEYYADNLDNYVDVAIYECVDTKELCKLCSISNIDDDLPLFYDKFTGMLHNVSKSTMIIEISKILFRNYLEIWRTNDK